MDITERHRGGAEWIKLLFVDVDGVLTDGRILMDERGEEVACFYVRDGLGLKRLMSAGVEVVIVTGRTSGAVLHRARELGITQVYQGVQDKGALCRQVIRERGLQQSETASMGDDLPDLDMFSETGLAIAVADAADEVRSRAHLVTTAPGGRGAVREACEWILNHQRGSAKNGFTVTGGG